MRSRRVVEPTVVPLQRLLRRNDASSAQSWGVPSTSAGQAWQPTLSRQAATAVAFYPVSTAFVVWFRVRPYNFIWTCHNIITIIIIDHKVWPHWAPLPCPLRRAKHRNPRPPPAPMMQRDERMVVWRMRSWPPIAKVSAIPLPMLDICHPWYTARLNRCGQPKRPRSISDSISLQAGHLFLFDPCLVVFEWLCFWNVFWVTLLIDVNLLFMLRRRHRFGLTVLSRHDMGIRGGLQYHVISE